MKKAVVFITFITLFSCVCFAQDSLNTGNTKKGTVITQKKNTPQQRSNAIPADSVNEGKIVSSPHVKTAGKSPVWKKKTGKK